MGVNGSSRSTAAAGGFTLMEILAALVLIGVVLPAVMKGLAMVSILDSAQKYEALDLAEGKLAEVLAGGDWESGSDSGDFEPDYVGYEWIVDVSDWTRADLKRIDVTVRWERRDRVRQIHLSTLVYDAQ